MGGRKLLFLKYTVSKEMPQACSLISIDISRQQNRKRLICIVISLSRVVFVVSFFCLLAAQVTRMIMDYGENKLDYTG